MGYYPIHLEMTGRRCLVVGGGAVVERKVEGLVSVGAAVTVVSPRVTDKLATWARLGKINHRARNYLNGDLTGYELAFVATDDDQVNAAVYDEGKRRGVWVNAADDPAHCDFILPSVLRRGELTVAVSTGGKSPALSRAIREELESYFTGEYNALAGLAAEVREELRARSITTTYDAWRKALNGDLRRLVLRGDLAEAKSFLLKELGAPQCE